MPPKKKAARRVVNNNLANKAKEVADDLFAHADAVIVVAVRFSGNGDSDEQILRCSRGSQLALGKAVDRLYDYDEERAAIWVDDYIDGSIDEADEDGD